MTVITLICLIAGGAGLVHTGSIHCGEAYTLDSEFLGPEQEILVSVPETDAGTPAGYPVLIVLDGDRYFSMACALTEALSSCGGMPEVIVAGLSTQDPMSYYTPTCAQVPDGTVIPGSGKGIEYLDYLELEVIPALEDHFPAEPYTILFGHSIAGMFTLYTMLEGRGIIEGYIASSPSLWWDRELLTALVQGLEGESDRSIRLYISMGNEGETMLPPAERFLEALEPRSDVDACFRLFPETSHQYVPFKSFAYGIEHIFSPWSPDAPAEELSLAEITAHYQGISGIYGYTITVPETLLNRMGYRALGNNDLEGALEVFRLNVQYYPRSANVYDSLGEALLLSGDTTGSVDNYMRSLELDPENTNARNVLESLEMP